MIKQIIFIQFIFIQIAFAQSYGSLRITNYADDKKSAFSLTFDDGLKTQYDYVKPILDQYGFKGTFYILPPFLVDSNQGTIWRYGTWNEFQQLAEDDNEIGSHTMNHDTLTLWNGEILLLPEHCYMNCINQRNPLNKKYLIKNVFRLIIHIQFVILLLIQLQNCFMKMPVLVVKHQIIFHYPVMIGTN